MEKTEQVRLSSIEKKKLEDLCSNRLNWTDGGYWMGRGSEPNCSQSIYRKITHTRIIKFPTDQLANQWNDKKEKDIRYLGHLGSAVMTMLLFPVSGVLGSFAGLGGGMLLTEAMADIEYPKMERGWALEVRGGYEYFWSPHPYSPKKFIITIEMTSFNHINQVQGQWKRRHELSPDDLPSEMIEKIMSGHNTHKTIIPSF